MKQKTLYDANLLTNGTCCPTASNYHPEYTINPLCEAKPSDFMILV